MDLIDQIRELSARVQKQLPHIQTEEATKNALVRFGTGCQVALLHIPPRSATTLSPRPHSHLP